MGSEDLGEIYMMEEFSGQFSTTSDQEKLPKCLDLGLAFDYSIHGIVEILPMEPISIPATHSDKSPSRHPSKNKESQFGDT